MKEFDVSTGSAQLVLTNLPSGPARDMNQVISKFWLTRHMLSRNLAAMIYFRLGTFSVYLPAQLPNLMNFDEHGYHTVSPTFSKRVPEMWVLYAKSFSLPLLFLALHRGDNFVLIAVIGYRATPLPIGMEMSETKFANRGELVVPTIPDCAGLVIVP